MTPCQCEACAVPPAPTFTREYRVACEVRTVLGWPLHERREYLELVEKKRGVLSRGFLEQALREEHARRRGHE